MNNIISKKDRKTMALIEENIEINKTDILNEIIDLECFVGKEYIIKAFPEVPERISNRLKNYIESYVEKWRELAEIYGCLGDKSKAEYYGKEADFYYKSIIRVETEGLIVWKDVYDHLLSP